MQYVFLHNVTFTFNKCVAKGEALCEKELLTYFITYTENLYLLNSTHFTYLKQSKFLC